MSISQWSLVTKQNVLNALKKFDTENPDYPAAKNTFLIVNNRKYPAKHIRGMAYKDAFNVEISKQDYTGGMETVKFFNNLGFDVIYKGALINSNIIRKANKVLVKKCNLKIGLYLQRHLNWGEDNNFEVVKEMVKASNIDIFVFPEECYTPFSEEMHKVGIGDCDRTRILESCEHLSRELGKAVIVSSYDRDGFIFSVFYNSFATNDDTKFQIYIKHTQTNTSAFEYTNYKEVFEDLFEPINFKGYKIGLTICYDCNFSLFSRIYGLNNIDLIINSTGGNVKREKWYKYNKARAIENNCYTLVTMGETKNKINSYVFGFNKNGGELKFHNLMKPTNKDNEIGTVYEYDLNEDNEQSSPDPYLHQPVSPCKYQDLEIQVGNSEILLLKAKYLKDSIYCYQKIYRGQTHNIIFCVIDSDDILKPEIVLSMLYNPILREIKNKKYVLINRYKQLDQKFYEEKLSTILKVRALENYCAVILESDLIKQCFLPTMNRGLQVVENTNGKFIIDLNRTGGPEAIWKNKYLKAKNGGRYAIMKAEWRNNFEWLIQEAVKESSKKAN